MYIYSSIRLMIYSISVNNLFYFCTHIYPFQNPHRNCSRNIGLPNRDSGNDLWISQKWCVNKYIVDVKTYEGIYFWFKHWSSLVDYWSITDLIIRSNKTQCQLCKRLAWPIISLSWSGLVCKRVSPLDVGIQQPFSCVLGHFWLGDKRTTRWS